MATAEIVQPYEYAFDNEGDEQGDVQEGEIAWAKPPLKVQQLWGY